jgi:hypothetical protein
LGFDGTRPSAALRLLNDGTASLSSTSALHLRLVALETRPIRILQ